MNWAPGIEGNVVMNMPDLNAEEQQVVDAIKTKGSAMQIDELAWKTGIPPGVLATLLLHLEFKNIIKALPGKLYQLTW
jgi:DNA processing protein